MDAPATPPVPRLLDLVEPDRWQRLQRHFADVVSVGIRTVSATRELLTEPSWPPGFPGAQAMRELSIGEELTSLLPLREPPRDLSSLTTRIGVTFAIVPVRATVRDIIAYLIVGPVVVGPREEERQFRDRISRAGLDAEALWSTLLSLRLYSFRGIQSVLALLEQVGTALVEIAYQARQLSALVPATGKVDQAMVRYYTDRVLRSLLEAATKATRADGGSVMTDDGEADGLRIRVAEGLSHEVIATTRLARDQGLAGLAMSSRAILLIDDQTSNPQVRSRMARKDLLSSLVAPLRPRPDQRPIGVLSLRTRNPQGRFTGEHVELLRRLLDLAGTALGSLCLRNPPN